MTGRIDVVVPARDEADRIDGCIRSVLEARAALAVVRPDVVVGLTIVLDRCRDRTAAVVAAALVGARRRTEVLSIEVGAVGAARRAGVDAALRHPTRGGRWLAFTDADTRVPTAWLSRHLDAADSGAAAYVGGVVPDAGDLDPVALDRWRATHDGQQALGHVHGANLGIRAVVYTAVGGFAAVREHEDVDLVRRVRDAGLPVRASLVDPVVTSGRFTGRTPGGYAAHLARTYGGVPVRDPAID